MPFEKGHPPYNRNKKKESSDDSREERRMGGVEPQGETAGGALQVEGQGAEAAGPGGVLQEQVKKLRYEISVNGLPYIVPKAKIEVDSEEEAIEMARRRILQMHVRRAENGTVVYVYPLAIKQVKLRRIE